MTRWVDPVPPPSDLDRRPRDLIGELSTVVPERAVATMCADLVLGQTPELWLLPWLAGRPGAHYPGPGWDEYWPRVWGARGLLYVWDEEAAAPAIAHGVRDSSWRVAEMCLKVARRHELPVGDDAAALVGHDLPRVRVAALRALAVCGDHEHVSLVRDAEARLDQPAAARRAAALASHALRERLDVGDRPQG